MANRTSIEWTNVTWNPVTGCTKVSPGCDNCYAERIAERFRNVKGHPFENGFDLVIRPERAKAPIDWKKPLMVFVNSMSDLFHKEIPRFFIDQIFDTMERSYWHKFQVLTKRSSLMRDYVNERYKKSTAPSHIWLGASVEDETRASRIQHVKSMNAQVKFLSIEPLLAPLGDLDLQNINWVIVGGESGPRARPMDPRWVREIRDQCIAAHVPFFFKQWGGSTAKSGGRELDGVIWDQFPQDGIGHQHDQLQQRRESWALG